MWRSTNKANIIEILYDINNAAKLKESLQDDMLEAFSPALTVNKTSLQDIFSNLYHFIQSLLRSSNKNTDLSKTFMWMLSRIKYLEFNDKSMKEMQDVIYRSVHYRLDPSIITGSKECMNCIDKLYIDLEGISVFDATDDTSDFLQTLLKKRKDSINSLKINASSLGLLKNMHIRVDEIDQEEKKTGKQF